MSKNIALMDAVIQSVNAAELAVDKFDDSVASITQDDHFYSLHEPSGERAAQSLKPADVAERLQYILHTALPSYTANFNASVKEEFNATSTLYLVFVLLAFSLQVGRVPIEDVDVVWFHVDMGEEVLVHEAMIALRVVAWDAHILILVWSAQATPRCKQGHCETFHTMLKVMTLRNEISPALWRRTRCS